MTYDFFSLHFFSFSFFKLLCESFLPGNTKGEGLLTLVIRWLDGTELLSNVRDNTREILAPLLGITINLMKLAAGDVPLVAVTFHFHT